MTDKTAEPRTVLGYMCLTDWECELGSADGGNLVYPSVEDLRDHRRCVESCGIALVEVRCLAVIQPRKDQDAR